MADHTWFLPITITIENVRENSARHRHVNIVNIIKYNIDKICFLATKCKNTSHKTNNSVINYTTLEWQSPSSLKTGNTAQNLTSTNRSSLQTVNATQCHGDSGYRRVENSRNSPAAPATIRLRNRDRREEISRKQPRPRSSARLRRRYAIRLRNRRVERWKLQWCDDKPSEVWVGIPQVENDHLVRSREQRHLSQYWPFIAILAVIHSTDIDAGNEDETQEFTLVTRVFIALCTRHENTNVALINRV